MAYGNMTNAVAGAVASAAANNQIITNVEDLDTRLDVTEALTTNGGTTGTGNSTLSTRLGTGVTTASTATAQLATLTTRTTDVSGTVGIGNQQLSDRLGAGVTTAATADARFGSGVGTGANVTTGSASSQLTDLRTRTSAVEATTTNTSGAVGIGNQRLSDRLGPGVTNAATADDRFGTGVGTGSNVTTGSATSQLTDLRSRTTALEAATPISAVFVKRTGTSTSITSSWTSVPFATLAQGTMTGVSTSDNITYTLTAGTWDIRAMLYPVSGVNMVASIHEGASASADDPGNTELYSIMAGFVISGVGGVTVLAQIFVATATTRTFRVSAAAASTVALKTGVGVPRLSITRGS